MKKAKKLVAGLLACSMLGTMGIAQAVVSTPLSVDAAVDTNNDDWLHTVGNKIVDKNGNQVWLTGANWFGFNCSECFPHGLWSADMSDTLKACADHGINILRIPVSTELLYTWMVGKPAECSGLNPSNNPYAIRNPELCNEDGSAMDSLGVFDVMLKYCKEYGIKVLVDVHSPDANNSGHNYELWYGKDFAGITAETAGVTCTTEIWIETWCWLAERYKNDDTLIALDLKNEPHGKRGYKPEVPADLSRWDDSTAENNWKYAAETCANEILKINPNVLILVEGIEQYPADGYTTNDPDVWEAPSGKYWWGAWWGGNLRGVKDYPLNLGANQDQLVYSPHDYGPLVYNQKWFANDFTTQTLLDDYWYGSWAYINEENIAPLLIGEWGGTLDGGKNEQWMNLIRDYMKDNVIHHTFWCLNPNSGDTGGLLSYDFVTWDEEKYSILEKALWQNDSGKYIGLDHQTPLGDNGLSLSQYYGSAPPIIVDPPTFVPGDVTGDGKVNVQDVAKLAKAALNLVTLTDTEKKAGDVTGDGKINVQDVAKVAKAALGKITL